MLSLSDLNVLIVVLFMVGILIIGIMSGRKITTVEEYALGRRRAFSPYAYGYYNYGDPYRWWYSCR